MSIDRVEWRGVREPTDGRYEIEKISECCSFAMGDVRSDNDERALLAMFIHGLFAKEPM